MTPNIVGFVANVVVPNIEVKNELEDPSMDYQLTNPLL
jgi:hypothetical protein